MVYVGLGFDCTPDFDYVGISVAEFKKGMDSVHLGFILIGVLATTVLRVTQLSCITL
jgi:hypothetical protein